MDMTDQRLVRNRLEQEPGRIGQPIMSMDHIESFSQPESRDQTGIAIGIAEEIRAVAAVAGAHLAERFENGFDHSSKLARR